MNQPPSPDPSLDGLLNALRSPATSDELSGETTAISAMVSAIADSTEGITSMSPTARRTPLTRPTLARSRRIIALTAIGVLGVAGVAAAGAGVFVPDNRPSIESDHDNDDEGVETTIADDESAETTMPATETSVADENNANDENDETDETDENDENESDDDSKDAAETTVADESAPADGTEVVCADGNHGMTVSSVAHATPPGPGHGAAVSAAAQSDCGKDSATTDTTMPGSETTAPDDHGSNGDGNGNGNKPADPGSQGNGNVQTDPGSQGNGNMPPGPATVANG